MSPRSAACAAASSSVSAIRGIAGLALRDAEPDRQVEREDRIGSSAWAYSSSGLRVVAQGVAGRERGERGVAGLARVVDRLVEVDGLRGAEPVAGQLARPARRAGHRRGLRALRATWRCARARRVGTEILVERVLDERVREVVAARRVGELAHQAPRPSRRRGCRAGRPRRSVVGSGQHIEVEVATDHRGHRQHPLGVGSEPPDARADHLAHAVGQRHLLRASRRRPSGPSASW